ncbi:MAG: hypothetical protein LBM96_12795 [Methanobrevibacter sp.]|jgi:hypothetical protein|nr:hypothetical protein [Candidatus Methanoflexus mossambicus]
MINFKKISIYLIIILFSIIFISNVYGSEITVSKDSNSNFTNINDAINYINGLSDNNNTILLNDGVYNSNSDLNNNITINGFLKIQSSNKSKTIIDGNSNSYLFKISPNSFVTFENISFINGVNTYGGAIYNEGTAIFINCDFINNQAIYGGAIYFKSLNQNGLIINGSNFTNNLNTIYISGNGGIIISSTIVNNLGGIYIDNESNNIFINYNRILNNSLINIAKNYYDIENYGNNTNLNLNWWGVNNPLDENSNMNNNGDNNMYNTNNTNTNNTNTNSNSNNNSNNKNIILDYGKNTNITYWYQIQAYLNDSDGNYEIISSNGSRNYIEDNGLALVYNFSLNKFVENDPNLLPKFIIKVICPFNNLFNRDRAAKPLSWGSGTNWLLPINKNNQKYVLRAFTDNEYLYYEMNYLASITENNGSNLKNNTLNNSNKSNNSDIKSNNVNNNNRNKNINNVKSIKKIKKITIYSKYLKPKNIANKKKSKINQIDLYIFNYKKYNIQRNNKQIDHKNSYKINLKYYTSNIFTKNTKNYLKTKIFKIYLNNKSYKTMKISNFKIIKYLSYLKKQEFKISFIK